MKFVRIFCITCLALFWCVTAWSEAGVKHGVKPVLIIQDKVHTFEQVLEGIDVRHDFIVHNKGDAVLKIEKVDST